MPTSYGKHSLIRFLESIPGRLFTTFARRLRRRNARRYERNNSIDRLVSDIDSHGHARSAALNERIQQLLAALGCTLPTVNRTRTALDALVVALSPLDHERAWIMLAIIRGRLPTVEQVRAAVRHDESDGTIAALRVAIWSGPAPRLLDAGPFPAVRIIRDAVLVDVHHTAQASFATGIQRVTREAVRRWLPIHRPTLIGWHRDLSSLRLLTATEIRRTCWGGPMAAEPEPGPVLIPINCTYLLPELATETDRTEALMCLAQYSSNQLSVIGYDMVPVTTAETCHPAIPPAFAKSLAATRYARTVATISEAAAVEYRGWTRMVRGIGLPGPLIAACVLPNEAGSSTESELADAGERLLLSGLPMVLVVGSHEPRKNHIAILHAAEMLWREGLRFSLTFIGARSWSSELFAEGLAMLQNQGRPIEDISAAADSLLWCAYRLARFTVFPSLNEGFGLPVVESIACGTPVITADFGSMREIAAQGGALMIDPRDDRSLADAMRRMLTDDALLQRLSAEAARCPTRTWDTYAAQVWDLLVS